MLHELVQTSARVAGTRSRKEKVALLAEWFASLQGDDQAIGSAFVVGELRQGRVGLGPAAVRDLSVAPAATATLSLGDVDEVFGRIAEVSGAGSKARRQELLAELFARATEGEQRFLRGLIVGEVRQGALQALLVEALAAASDLPATSVRRAVMLGGELPAVAVAALRDGEPGLARFRLELMRPIQPMLAGTAPSPAEALAKRGRAAFEWKLDGARIQVHRRGDDVRVFTRKLHDVTAAVPEVVEAARRLPADRLVLDGEVIALRPDGRPHPFQTTMRRFGRKLDVEALRGELPLSPFFFDVLHVGGDDLLEHAAAERWSVLADLVPAAQRVTREVLGDEADAEAFFERALDQGHEGLVVKDLDAPYEAGRRGGNWLKLKLAHTLDLVVLAAEWGSGRRHGLLSNLHLGARDPSTGGFVMLGKTFKGMTDEVLRQQTERLQALATEIEEHVVHVRPELVVEIAFDGIQRSPQYPAGLALRFARLRRYRADKSAAEADTIDAVRGLLPE